MKLITIFNEKGGVGKSSMGIMLASWLQYHLGFKVGVADFNERISQYRKNEITKREKLDKELKENGKEPLPALDKENAWPIVTFGAKERLNWEKDFPKNMHTAWLDEKIRNGEMKDRDFIILDFPGSLSGKEFLDFIAREKLNYVFIPTERDVMTISATIKTILIIKRSSKTPYAVFFNKVNAGLSNVKRQYVELAKNMMNKGYKVLPDMVAFSDKISTIDKPDLLRSTFYYPDFNNPEYGKSKDLGTVNLFIDMMREIRKTDDYPGTAPVDMSIVDTLVKTNDGKQFNGSSFPEYEINL